MSTTDHAVDEDRVLRNGCGLLDRSERGKLTLTGEQAQEFLNGQVSNDVLALGPGDGCYATFLTHKGKMLGDLRVLRVLNPASSLACEEAAPVGELWLDTERVSLQALFDLVRRFAIGYDVGLHKRTLERGLLSLVGPQARAVAGADDLGEREHANAPSTLGELDVHLIATAEGVDVLCRAQDTQAVRDALLQRGAVQVSETAAAALRIESGRPLYGVDIDDSTIPEEAGLNERAVSFTKGCYVGQETVARLHYRGRPTRRLRGLRLSAPAGTGDEVRLGERVVGSLGSVAPSPDLGLIALALLRREAEPGAVVSVGPEGVSAEVVELPLR
jgi:folate-binding protein YgfZ